MTPAELIRSARIRHGLSQRALALRAGTTQAWVSAIERGQARPSVDTLRRLLLVMGEELVLDSRPLTSDADHDPIALADARPRELLGPVRDALARMKLSPRGAS
jgi:transcriptional regulator with XRE-family HTH domain